MALFLGKLMRGRLVQLRAEADLEATTDIHHDPSSTTHSRFPSLSASAVAAGGLLRGVTQTWWGNVPEGPELWSPYFFSSWLKLVSRCMRRNPTGLSDIGHFLPSHCMTAAFTTPANQNK